MEEVDKIIIYTLKDIGCCLDDSVVSLSDLSPELVFEASVRCLQVIIPNINIPTTLSDNMAARFQHSASLAQACKSIGYKGEIGYQTFLYWNVVEFRKVIMFLIDQLPREQDKSTPQPTDTLSKTKALIAAVIKKELNERQSLTDMKSVRFISVDLETGISYPEKQTNLSPKDWREYCRKDLNWITEQCERDELFSSVCKLLDTGDDVKQSHVDNSTSSNKPKPKPRTRAQSSSTSLSPWLSLRTPLVTPKTKGADKIVMEGEETSENEINSEEMLMKQMEESKLRIAESSSALHELNNQLTQLKCELSEICGDKLKEVETRQRAASLLADKDPSIVDDVKKKVDERKQKLIVLDQQWQAHSEPLVQRIEQVETQIKVKQDDREKQLGRLDELKEQINELTQLVSVKSQQKNSLEHQLAKKSQQIHRSMYTQRILEIIGSIMKQKQDIEKILQDTRQVQKEISVTGGKLDRCYTVTDELIFKNAKKDEMSRRCYKLLATLHSDCNDIVSYIRETGILVREISDLQQQIETESNKKVGASLSRITSDLREMRSENELRRTQLEHLTSKSS